jgi:hypothetical protein
MIPILFSSDLEATSIVVTLPPLLVPQLRLHNSEATWFHRWIFHQSPLGRRFASVFTAYAYWHSSVLHTSLKHNELRDTMVTVTMVQLNLWSAASRLLFADWVDQMSSFRELWLSIYRCKHVRLSVSSWKFLKFELWILNDESGCTCFSRRPRVYSSMCVLIMIDFFECLVLVQLYR